MTDHNTHSVDIHDIYNSKMTDLEFNKLSTFIFKEYGIKMPPAKKIMLQSRLQKRLRELNIGSFKEYIDYVFNQKGHADEIIHMIDVVSTNKTDFFREPSHFDFMTSFILPEFIKTPSNRFFKVWSAGCSSGEEPYTLSIVLSEYMLQCPNFDFSIFATDISSRILQKAVTAIYDQSRIDMIPMTIKKRYFLKSKDSDSKSVRVIPQLRSRITFKRLNFMDAVYDAPHAFDLILCRNVLIYFDRDTQESVINKLCVKLKRGGYFMLGHSESIINLNVPLQQIKPTIYKRL